MRSTLLAVAAAALALGLAGAPAGAGTVTTQAVRGRLVPTDDSSSAVGKFRIVLLARAGGTAESLDLDALGLDATRDGDGNLPSYHAFLVTADAGTAADFGEMFLSPRGRAGLRFRTTRSDLPEGVRSLADFAGGTAEVRLGDTVVLSGEIPDFLGLLDGNDRGSGSAARALGRARLRATRDGGDAAGVLEALYANQPRETVEGIRVECLGLGSAGDTFTVVCIDDSSNETTLGTMTSRTRYGVAVLVLSSRAGDTMPGDGVLSLGGQRVEVRDTNGTAWLVGRFPVLSGS